MDIVHQTGCDSADVFCPRLRHRESLAMQIRRFAIRSLLWSHARSRTACRNSHPQRFHCGPTRAVGFCLSIMSNMSQVYQLPAQGPKINQHQKRHTPLWKLLNTKRKIASDCTWIGKQKICWFLSYLEVRFLTKMLSYLNNSIDNSCHLNQH